MGRLATVCFGLALLAQPPFAMASGSVQCAPSAGTAPSRVQRTRFTVDVSGQGPDVVLLPGLATPATVWDQTARVLAPSHRVHVVQVRGFADGDPGPNGDGSMLMPMVDELARYLADCAAQRPALVGHSMGGLAVLALAIEHPRVPARIIVVDAAPFIGPLLEPPAATVEEARPLADQVQAGLARMAATVPVEVPQGPVSDPGPDSQTGTQSNSKRGRTLIAGWLYHVDRCVVGQAFHDVLTTDLRGSIGRIEVPVDLIYAVDERRQSSARTTRAYLMQYAGARDFHAAAVPEAFHFLMLDQPLAFQRALAAALQRAPRSARGER
jgi:pimeloyl-ACP methyl ester carboxylesterase